jgi:hypothetical protein
VLAKPTQPSLRLTLSRRAFQSFSQAIAGLKNSDRGGNEKIASVARFLDAGFPIGYSQNCLPIETHEEDAMNCNKFFYSADKIAADVNQEIY